LIDSSDELENACELIPANRDSDSDSNEIHESDRKSEKHPQQRISTSRGIMIE
jgi:hypothetical protein